MKKAIKISIAGEPFVFKFNQFDEDVNLDKILQINPHRIPAEIITFPSILNRLGILLAEATNAVKEQELNLEVKTAQTKERLRIDLLKEKKENKYTNDDVNYFMRTRLDSDAKLRVAKAKLLKAEKNKEILNSIYWAAKDKSDKLSSVFEKVKSDEVMLDRLTGEFNGVKIIKATPD